MRAILAAVLRADSCYVDVGANRGQILGEAVRLAARGHHVAFEPIPQLAAALAADFVEVDCRALALGAQPGRASFCHYTRLDGWSGLLANPEISDEQGAPVEIEVEVSTLDDQLTGLDPVLIKIDVEGAEQSVLEGGRELLARARAAAPASSTSSRPRGFTAGARGRSGSCSTASATGSSRRPAWARPAREQFVRDARAIVNWLATPER